MAPRLSKRQQREQEELEALAGPSTLQNHSENEQESEEEVPLSRGAPSATSGFAALAADFEEDEVEQSSDDNKPKSVAKSKKSKKKKKKATVTLDHEPIPQQTKPAKGKKSQEDRKSRGKLGVDEDAFEKALAELSGKNTNLQRGSSENTSSSLSSYDAFNSLISVSLKHLDPETELRRFFGSKVISSSPAQKTSRAQAPSRSHLARPQQTWPPAHYRAGLSMRALTPEEVKNKGTGAGPDARERWWTVEAGPRYKGTTYEFMQCVMGGDPQLFFNLLQGMPWHADTLLQTAEVFRHREEYSAAADFLSRALFAYERSFAAAFNLTTGIHRLDFDAVENRVFYLALSRNVADLNRRGTPRTAFEFARLLFSLDPHTDPHGALLHLDCLAIRAGQATWLLDVWDAYDKMHALGDSSSGETRFDVTMMPGWHWARALALFDAKSDENYETANQALLSAILAYPSILPLLADKADVSMPTELRKLGAFEIVTDYSPYRHNLPTSIIHVLSHIYAIRAASLWKQPPRAAWLSDTLKSLSAQLSASLNGPVPLARTRLLTLFSEQSNLTDAIYRHIAVVAPLAPEFRRLTGFFPSEVKERLAQTIEGDPLPPVTAVSVYEDAYFTAVGVETRSRVGDRLAAELQRVFPDAVDRRQFQALFDAHPEIGARFPGGIVELAQMARQFPQEVLDAMLGMAADAGGDPVEGEEGRMPGGEAMFAEHAEQPLGLQAAELEREDVDDDADAGEGGDEEDEEEYDEPFLPVRIVRTLLGRLWSRNVPVDSDSDREDAEGEREEPETRQEPRADDVD